jgi:hypothetical protein
MSLKAPKSSLLDRVQSIPGLATRGVKAELVGRRSIKVSQNGRYVGLWREVIGSLEWYPAGQHVAQHRVLTSDEAASYLGRLFAGR